MTTNSLSRQAPTNEPKPIACKADSQTSGVMVGAPRSTGQNQARHLMLLMSCVLLALFVLFGLLSLPAQTQDNHSSCGTYELRGRDDTQQHWPHFHFLQVGKGPQQWDIDGYFILRGVVRDCQKTPKAVRFWAKILEHSCQIAGGLF